MAATLLVKNVLARVSILLQDTVPQFQRWTEAELVDWLNDAQAAIAKYLPHECSVLGAYQLSAGSRQLIDTIAVDKFKLPSGAPAAPINGNRFLKPIRNMGADGLTPGRAIRMADIEDMNSQDSDWHTRTGERVSSVLFDEELPRVFWVYPSAAGKWVEIALLAQPAPIPAGGTPGAPIYHSTGASTVAISISDQNLDELVDYVVARANMKDTTFSDAGKVVLHTQRFLGSINARAMAATGVNPNLRLLPGISPEAKRGA